MGFLAGLSSKMKEGIAQLAPFKWTSYARSWWETLPAPERIYFEVFTFPGLFRMESMWNPWNPWNECWLRAQPFSYSMDIMDSMWNEDGMINSTWIPHGFHWIPYGMQAYPPWIPWNSPYGFHGTNSIPWKFCWNPHRNNLI